MTNRQPTAFTSLTSKVVTNSHKVKYMEIDTFFINKFEIIFSDSGYVCMTFYKRDSNIMEIQQSGKLSFCCY